MLSPGVRLGPYEIVGSLGAGGMGEVYRATDTNLKRQVAIKVLPESVAGDAERLARFQREAEVLAQLNHPNIAQIHGLERANGHIALVMELVEGEDLSQRIARGAIPVDEALPIAKQIAEALEAAHEAGIVHRDLKPANVKVRADGTVKVLDFGLAKAMEPAGAALSRGSSQAPTITTPAMTQAGMILGTAAYMAPEQARGKPVDKRADIWAFGCVLYEMLTGQRAFGGEDVTETLAAVVKSEPEWDRVPTALAPSIRAFLTRCLAKNPKQRIADIQVVRLALEGAFETEASRVVESVSPRERVIWRRVWPSAAGAVVASLVVGLTAWSLWPSAAPRSVTRFSYDLPDGQVLRNAGRPVIAFSPDGRSIVYNTTQGLFLRTMDELEARLIAGTEADLSNPFFSPDGQWVAYWDRAETALKRIALTGGAPVVISRVPVDINGASWNSDDMILFGQPEGILRVAATGGTPALVIPAEDEEQVYGPQLLPDGNSVLFSVHSATDDPRWNEAQIVVQSLRTGERTVVLQGGSEARYVPTGHLVYSLGTNLFGMNFDVENRAVSGVAVPIVEGVTRGVANVGTGTSHYSISNAGTLVYLAAGGLLSPTRLVWVDRQGHEEPLAAPPRNYGYPRLAPDGTRVALSIADQQQDIWVWDLVRETLTRITFDPRLDQYPAWTPDGRRLLFDAYSEDGRQSLFWQTADGTGSREQLSESVTNPMPYSVSPDGSRVVLRVGNPPPYDLALLVLGNERRVEPLLTTPFSEQNAEISPDGNWLAYQSDESGRAEIYVRPFPNVEGGRWQVSNDGGTRPLWARSGEELFYLVTAGVDATMMSVRVERGATWTANTPSKLFAGRFFFRDTPGSTGQGRTFDVSPDGQRFLMLQAGTDTSQPRFIFVQNFVEQLKRLVPTN